MSTYRMSDGTVVKTENATQVWEQARDWNGSNHIGRSSRSQWHDEYLNRSRKGRYYKVYESRVQGETDSAEWVSNEEAARWLIFNDHELPEELKALEEQITE
jgi:hypothetical protein